MRKYLYFRDVADENDDDDQSSSIAIPADAIVGMAPQAITTLDVYIDTKKTEKAQTLRFTVTRGKIQEVMQELVAHINGYTHNKAPLQVMADAATTTVNADSIEGDDKTKSTIFFSEDVTAIGISAV
tara:strand:+ start:2805 stop:3185 length:381 start_codon:yes stop_codon:yes gene_type:complete